MGKNLSNLPEDRFELGFAFWGKLDIYGATQLRIVNAPCDLLQSLGALEIVQIVEHLEDVGFLDGIGLFDLMDDAVAPGEIYLDAIYENLFLLAGEGAFVDEASQLDVLGRVFHIQVFAEEPELSGAD